MTLPHHALRQSAASLFAYALLEVFPQAQLMESEISQIGFYYTFFLEQPLEEGVITLLEEKMRALVKLSLPVEAKDMMRENAVEMFRHYKQAYKAELAANFSFNIVPILKIGSSFFDLAPPPYVSTTSDLAAFKLQSLEKVKEKEHIFCITGTVFSDTRSLKSFLKNFEAAKRKDHRNLGRELNLFTHVDELGKDGWFWLPKGAFIRDSLLDWWRSAHKQQGFSTISTPRLVKARALPRSSNREGLPLKVNDDIQLVNSLEPLHAMLFRAQQHSYRDLPVRYMECGELHTNPPQTTGLFQSCSSTVERAQIFCSEKQVLGEFISSLQFIEKTVNILGFEYQWNLALRGSKFAGTIEKWDKVLGWMVTALQQSKCDYIIDSSEGAFNGPRMVVRMKDALGREWDGPFIEVNLNHSERFGLRYQDADGEMHIPYMITRSMFGSLERCIAILVECTGGVFPLWLAPEQVRLLPISAAHHTYADSVCKMLVSAGVRCRVDYRQEPLGAKVHAVEREKVPYTVVIGAAEEKDGVVNVRSCSLQGQTKRMKLTSFLQLVQEEAAGPVFKDTKKSYSEE